MTSEDNGQACPMPPTIEGMAKRYGLPDIVRLFNEKAKNVTVASAYSVNIEELDVKDADCAIKFSYLAAFTSPHRSEPLEGFKLSVENIKDGDIITEAIHCMTDDFPGRFNLATGHTGCAFESLQFIMDNPPEKIVKRVLLIGMN